MTQRRLFASQKSASPPPSALVLESPAATPRAAAESRGGMAATMNAPALGDSDSANKPPTPGASSWHSPPSYAPAVGAPNSAQATAAAALKTQHHSPTSHGTTATGRKRKAAGAPGSRGVANLTPEQLAKKRANDREAQRAIRERTRNTIEGLERRIRELESQQPLQDLQRVVAERDRALADCDELRRKLSQVSQIVGSAYAAAPLLGGGAGAAPAHTTVPGGLNELAALTAQQSPLPPLGQAQQQQQEEPPQQHLPYYPPAPQSPTGQSAHEPHLHPDLRSSPYPHGTPGSQSAVSAVYANDEGSSQKWSPSADHPPHQQYSAQPNGIAYEQQRSAPTHEPQINGERPGAMGLNFVLDSVQQQTNSSLEGQAAVAAAVSAYGSPPSSSTPIFAKLPRGTAPSTPLETLLNDFIARSHQKLAAGVPMHDILGPEYPSFVAFRDPNRFEQQQCHPISALLIDILSKFPDISTLPEKVASLYVMFLVMRWFLCPCEACYERLPEWMRPVAEQLEKPHAIWIDNLPWSVSSPSLEADEFDFRALLSLPSTPLEEPASSVAVTFANTFIRPFMRKQLVTSSGPDSAVKFEDFFVPYTTTMSLNWPYPQDQVLIPVKSSGHEGHESPEADICINPVFEAHLRDLKNWSLGTRFESTFPDLVQEDVRIEDHAVVTAP